MLGSFDRRIDVFKRMVLLESGAPSLPPRVSVLSPSPRKYDGERVAALQIGQPFDGIGTMAADSIGAIGFYD
jgi:hypothetical protein